MMTEPITRESNALSDLYQRVHREKGYYGSAWRHEGRSVLMAGEIGTLALGTRVLDLGCRDGFLTSKFLSGCNVTGIDIDAESLKLYESNLKNMVQNIKTVTTDLNQKLPFADGSFDIVIAGEIIEHLIQPSLFASEIRRILDKGGRLVGSTPNAARLDKRLQLIRGRDPKEFSDPTHLQYFTKNSLGNILSRSFDLVEIIPYRKNRPCRIFSSLLSDGFVFVCK